LAVEVPSRPVPVNQQHLRSNAAAVDNGAKQIHGRTAAKVEYRLEVSAPGIAEAQLAFPEDQLQRLVGVVAYGGRVVDKAAVGPSAVEHAV